MRPEYVDDQLLAAQLVSWWRYRESVSQQSCHQQSSTATSLVIISSQLSQRSCGGKRPSTPLNALHPTLRLTDIIASPSFQLCCSLCLSTLSRQ